MPGLVFLIGRTIVSFRRIYKLTYKASEVDAHC